MRSILGLAFLVAASLGGIEYATKLMPTSAATSAPQVQATLLAPPLAPTTETFGGIIETVAAIEKVPLPPVTVAPLAPHAEPINPIVEPIKRPPPKMPLAKSVTKSAPVKAAAHKSHASKTKVAKAKQAAPTKHASTSEPIVTVTRPGFKLTCTVAQKLDPAKQRCVPLKRQH